MRSSPPPRPRSGTPTPPNATPRCAAKPRRSSAGRAGGGTSASASCCDSAAGTACRRRFPTTYGSGSHVPGRIRTSALDAPSVAAEAQRSWHFPRLTRHATSATLSAWLRSPSSSPRGTSCAAFSSGKDYRFPTTRNSEKTRASSRFVAGTGRDDHHDRDIQARWARSAVGNCSDFFQRRNGTRCAYGCRHGRRRPDAACAGGRSRRPRGRRDLACRRGSLMARSDRDR